MKLISVVSELNTEVKNLKKELAEIKTTNKFDNDALNEEIYKLQDKINDLNEKIINIQSIFNEKLLLQVDKLNERVHFLEDEEANEALKLKKLYDAEKKSDKKVSKNKIKYMIISAFITIFTSVVVFLLTQYINERENIKSYQSGFVDAVQGIEKNRKSEG